MLYLGIFALFVGVIAAAVVLDDGVWPEGPRVSARELRTRLARSGLDIEWRRGRTGHGVAGVVAGMASRGGRGRVGFELAVAAGDHADGGMLGRAGFPLDYPIRNSPCDVHPCRYANPKWFPDPQGVLGNVAYGVYHLARENQDDEPTIARIDDVLFASFSTGDPRAFPVLRRPPPDPGGWLIPDL